MRAAAKRSAKSHSGSSEALYTTSLVTPGDRMRGQIKFIGIQKLDEHNKKNKDPTTDPNAWLQHLMTATEDKPDHSFLDPFFWAFCRPLRGGWLARSPVPRTGRKRAKTIGKQSKS
jgi:hypothetical protein